MISYYFSTEYKSQNFLKITILVESNNEIETLELPSWRPGRYELGNFSKNIRDFKVFNQDNKRLKFEKKSKDTWEIYTDNASSLRIEYQYYANELNAGSTFISPYQLYVNPVNCCMYMAGMENERCELHFPDLKPDYQIACGLPIENGILKAKNFEQLVDSPFICSPTLQHKTFEIESVIFHLWFQGEIKVDWEKMIPDFEKFSRKQIEKFIEFPVNEYHFLFQITTYPSYHGVEHLTSTVILLGPSFDVFYDKYQDLLGISSHELYHSWNVKSIRPIEMSPYDYKQENYSKLGYISEGVTTYMGDLMLYKSKVISEKEYLSELTQQLQKHFENFGRFNYSVAESSFDTWLDGYVPGVPRRKVSIYTEGCLLAFVIDVKIMKATNGKKSLDDVMRQLYFEYALNNEGITEEIYKNLIEKILGENLDEFFNDYVNGTRSYEGILVDTLDELGYELETTPSAKYSEAKLGFKTTSKGLNFIVSSIYPGSPAEMGGLMLNDEIIGVNNVFCNGELDKWFIYFHDDIKNLMVKRGGVLVTIKLPEVSRNFYQIYSIKKMSDLNALQKRIFDKWSN